MVKLKFDNQKAILTLTPNTQCLVRCTTHMAFIFPLIELIMLIMLVGFTSGNQHQPTGEPGSHSAMIQSRPAECGTAVPQHIQHELSTSRPRALAWEAALRMRKIERFHIAESQGSL